MNDEFGEFEYPSPAKVDASANEDKNNEGKETSAVVDWASDDEELINDTEIAFAAGSQLSKSQYCTSKQS